MRLVWLAAVVFLACVAASCAGGGSGPDATATPPASSGPVTFTAPNGQSALSAARRDAAKRAGADPVGVTMHDVEVVGLSGCLGVKAPPNQACAEFLAAGMVAFFRAGSQDLRYHVLGQQVVGPVQPADVADVGSDIDGLRFDLTAKLAAYALDDIQLRDGVPVASLTVTAVVPDGNAASVVVEGGRAPLSYRLDAKAGVSRLQAAVDVPTPLAALQLAMREDLAKRLGVPLPQVSILDYREVTWPDGCLGVRKPGGVCTQALVPGFLAVLGDSSGREYEYHGAGTSFVAASLEPGAVVTGPLP